MAKLVAKTYGEALFELASEQNIMTQLMEEIKSLREILKANPDLDNLMKHPGIPKQEKGEVLDKIFGGRISKELAGFLQVIVTKERYGDLPAIFDYFTEKVKQYEGIGVAYVTTAVVLDAVQRLAVEEKLLHTTGYRRLEMHYETDVALIGGMRIRIGDRVVDSSIQSKLEALTKQLLEIQLA